MFALWAAVMAVVGVGTIMLIRRVCKRAWRET